MYSCGLHFSCTGKVMGIFYFSFKGKIHHQRFYVDIQPVVMVSVIHFSKHNPLSAIFDRKSWILLLVEPTWTRMHCIMPSEQTSCWVTQSYTELQSKLIPVVWLSSYIATFRVRLSSKITYRGNTASAAAKANTSMQTYYSCYLVCFKWGLKSPWNRKQSTQPCS